MSIFFCDSNSELWYERQENLGIRYISMPYTLDGKEYYYDLGKETDFADFFDQMRRGARVTTSALNKQDYLDYFRPILEEGDDVFYLTFSHKMSATFNQMDEAIRDLKKEFPERKITVYDSRLISIGTAELVEFAAKLHNDGVGDEELLSKIDAHRKRSAVHFTPETLSYLARGGRLTKGKAAMGNLFNIKPMITFDTEGNLLNYDKVNGRKKALKYLSEQVAKTGVDIAYPIYIDDADIKADADFLEELVREIVGDKAEIRRQPVGPVIGCHCGPGTIGIAWISDKDLY